jgi:hypothetical protein
MFTTVEGWEKRSRSKAETLPCCAEGCGSPLETPGGLEESLRAGVEALMGRWEGYEGSVETLGARFETLEMSLETLRIETERLLRLP